MLITAEGPEQSSGVETVADLRAYGRKHLTLEPSTALFRYTPDAALRRLACDMRPGLDGFDERATFFGRVAGFSIRFPINSNAITAENRVPYFVRQVR